MRRRQTPPSGWPSILVNSAEERRTRSEYLRSRSRGPLSLVRALARRPGLHYNVSVMETGYAAGFRRRVEEQRERRRTLSKEIAGRLRAAAHEAAAEFPSMQRLTLFGSAAAGRAETASDADVLVEGLRPEEYFSLRRFLAERLEREVDLHSDTEPADFVQKVRERGACVYERKA